MTTINLTLSPELEQRLRTEAFKQGLEPDLYILNTLQERLQPDIPTSQPTEADLLQQINIGFSAQTWDQYHTLIAKRRAETLSPEEHDQVQLSNRLENLNVVRIQALIQLANLRNQTLEDLMRNLGINPEAILLSMEEYNRIIGEKQLGLGSSLKRFRQELTKEGLEIDPDEVFKDVRDRSPGREVVL
jgi:hypothetical protein